MNNEPKTISEIARLGGIARAKSLTKKRRIEIARNAGQAPKTFKKRPNTATQDSITDKRNDLNKKDL